jgi:hypothetical protein
MVEPQPHELLVLGLGVEGGQGAPIGVGAVGVGIGPGLTTGSCWPDVALEAVVGAEEGFIVAGRACNAAGINFKIFVFSK